MVPRLRSSGEARQNQQLPCGEPLMRIVPALLACLLGALHHAASRPNPITRCTPAVSRPRRPIPPSPRAVAKHRSRPHRPDHRKAGQLRKPQHAFQHGNRPAARSPASMPPPTGSSPSSSKSPASCGGCLEVNRDTFTADPASTAGLPGPIAFPMPRSLPTSTPSCAARSRAGHTHVPGHRATTTRATPT